MQSWPSISPTTSPSFENPIFKSTGIIVNVVTVIDQLSSSTVFVDSDGVTDCVSEEFKLRFDKALSSTVEELLPGNQQLNALHSTIDELSTCTFESQLTVKIVEYCSSGDCMTIGRTNEENGSSVWQTVQGLTTLTDRLLFQMTWAGINTREISIQAIVNDGYEVAFSHRSDTRNPTSSPSITPSITPSAFPTSNPSEWVPLALVDDGFYTFTGFGSCIDSDGGEYTNYLELKGDWI